MQQQIIHDGDKINWQNYLIPNYKAIYCQLCMRSWFGMLIYFLAENQIKRLF